jgi:acyl carrier protein
MESMEQHFEKTAKLQGEKIIMATIDKVCELILKVKRGVPAADLTPGARLVEDLKLDSLSMVELMVQAEDAFSVKVPLTDAAELTTIGLAVAYFDKRIANKGAANV